MDCSEEQMGELLFYARRALVCFMPQEKVMDGSKKFPDFCSICGTDNQSLLANMESETVKALCGDRRAYPMCERCLEEGFSPVTHGSADQTGAAYKRSKGGARKKKKKAESDDEELTCSSSNEDSVEIAARPKKKEKAPPRAPTPTPRADPPPTLLGVPPLEQQLSQSGCSFGSSCKFQAAESTTTLNTCSLCGNKKAHHLCCNENALLKDFVGELGGCNALLRLCGVLRRRVGRD